jgi:hypothetical protein
MRLALRADEHVRRRYVLALRETGYDVEWVDGAYEAGTLDTQHLSHSAAAGRTLFSNDADVARLHAAFDDSTLPSRSAGPAP